MVTIPPSRQRLITGFSLAGILLVAVFLGGWFLHVLVLGAVLLGLWEFYGLFWPGNTQLAQKGLGFVLAGGFVLSASLTPEWPILFVSLALCASALMFLARFGSNHPETRITDYTVLPFGLLYIALPLSLALHMHPAEQIFVVLVSTATDCGGYYAGMMFGRHKMWPSVSPKKTWQGAAGGLVTSIAVCLVAGHLASRNAALGLPAMSFWLWLTMGILLNAAAQLGDFFESALKRSLNVKDSGTILPGHGGVLDRIDSLLFVLPLYFVFRALYAAVALLTTPLPTPGM